MEINSFIYSLFILFIYFQGEHAMVLRNNIILLLMIAISVVSVAYFCISFDDLVITIRTISNFHLYQEQRATGSGPHVLNRILLQENNVSRELHSQRQVRILCWIMTYPKNLDKQAKYVKSTWGRRCDILLFMSSVQNDTFPTVGLNISEGRVHLTAKTMLAFRYIYTNYFDKADWFLKADDDTYVIVENLRHFLSEQNTEQAVYFGHHFKSYTLQGYMSGGAGYCLSKEALRRFGEKPRDSLCSEDGGDEDEEFGQCMLKLGVKAGISTDSFGRSRFHCFDPETHLSGNYPKWYHGRDDNGGRKGQDSISDYAISFHYVSPEMMQILELCIYHLKLWTQI